MAMINHYFDKSDVKAWVDNRLTQHVFGLILARFNHQKWLLSSEIGVDRYIGRAEVLQYLLSSNEILNLVEKDDG